MNFWGVKNFQYRYNSKAGFSAEWSRMAVGMHSTIAIAQYLLGGGEIWRRACNAFELGAPKFTYNRRFSINSQIEPQGHNVETDVTFFISGNRNAKLKCFYRPSYEVSNRVKIGGGGPPIFFRNLGLNFKIWPPISQSQGVLRDNFGIMRCGIDSRAQV